MVFGIFLFSRFYNILLVIRKCLIIWSLQYAFTSQNLQVKMIHSFSRRFDEIYVGVVIWMDFLVDFFHFPKKWFVRFFSVINKGRDWEYSFEFRKPEFQKYNLFYFKKNRKNRPDRTFPGSDIFSCKVAPW